MSPDFAFEESAKAELNGGFKVEVVGTLFSAATNNNGYFEITNIPENTAGYTIKISKPNFLHREIKNVILKGNVQLGSEVSPVSMWIGDLLDNGVQDNAINMIDVRILAEAFNSSVGDTRYVNDYDLNKDGAVNMVDVRIIADHFNKSTDSYQ